MDVDCLVENLQQIQKAGRGKEKVLAFDPDDNGFYEVSGLEYGGVKAGEGVVTISTYDTDGYCMITDNVKYYADSKGVLNGLKEKQKKN